MHRCLSREPAERGASLAELAARLGPSTRDGRQAVAACVRAHESGWRRPGCRAMVGDATGEEATQNFSRLAGSGRGLRGRGRGDPLSHLVRHRAPAGGRRRWRRQQLARATGSAAGDRRRRKRRKGSRADGPARRAREAPQPAAARAPAKENVLLLSGNTAVDAETLKLRPGLIVRGLDGARPLLLVGGDGLRVAVAGVQFEGVDFVWTGSAPRDTSSAPRERLRAALVRLDAADVAFSGCTFRGSAAGDVRQVSTFPPESSGGSDRPAAIVCVATAARADGEPAARRVALSNCIVRGLGAAVVKHGAVELTIDARQTLLADGGSLLPSTVVRRLSNRCRSHSAT